MVAFAASLFIQWDFQWLCVGVYVRRLGKKIRNELGERGACVFY